MDGRRRAVLEWAIAVAVLGAYTAVLFLPLLAHLVHGGPARWLEGDVAEEYWPDLVALCHGLHHGHIPRWNPWEHGGTPFAADPQAAVYHPVNLALCALGGPSPSIHWADFRVALHIWLGCVFMALFLRGERLSWRGAMAGAVLFPLTPFVRHNWELNLTWGFAFLPLVLWSVRDACVRPTMARAVGLGLVCALPVLTGSPPAVYYTALIALPFAVHCTWEARPAGAMVLARTAVLSVATVVGLTAPAALSAGELAGLSVRSRPTYAAMAAEGLPLRGALGVLLPRLNDHAYVGLLSLALAALAFVRPATFRARWVFLAVALVGAVWMTGDHGPVFPMAWAVVPGARWFRNPTRYSALWGTAVAVLAAAGVDALPTVSRRAMALTVAVPLVVGATVLVHPSVDPWTHGEGLARAVLALTLGGLCALASTRWRAASGLVIVALCADLWAYLPAARHTRAGPLPEGARVYAAWRALTGNRWQDDRVWDEFGVGFRAGERYGMREMRGYRDPMELSRYQKVVDSLGALPGLLAQYNVRWVLRGPHYMHGAGHYLLPDPSGAPWALDHGSGIYELPAALPSAYWTDGAVVVRDADAALDAVRAAAPTPQVVLEAGDVGEGTVTQGQGRWSPAMARVDGDTVTVRVDAPTAGWLLVNEVWFPGWFATVDGVATEIHRANALVRAVRVPPGRHRVVMVYNPWVPRWAEPVALATLLAALGTLGWRSRKRGIVTTRQG